MLANIAIKKIELNENIEARAVEYNRLGVDLFDSLHIACSEEAKVNVMLSTNDNLIKKAKRMVKPKIYLMNPDKWLMEVTDNEYND